MIAKHLVRLIRRGLYSSIGQKIIYNLDAIVQDSRHRILKESLGHCGANVTLYLPITLLGPSEVRIGNDVSINAYVHMWGHGSITVGDRVMIASHVAITSLTHDPSSEIMHKSLISKPVTIEDDVWIGSHAVILPGVTIGKGAVVAAGCVVNKDVAPYTIVAGVPCKILRYRDTRG